MKIRTFAHFLFSLLLATSFVTSGCKHKPSGPTPLPGRTSSAPKPGDEAGGGGSGKVKPGTGTGDENSEPKVATDQHPLTDIDLDKYNQDREVFKANTVYFDFDKSTVKTGERTKIQEVATYLKGTAQNKLLIEGYCDERGTEEYNRALGEKRALALREYLAKLGIKADRVVTRSYGEDKPAAAGHDEAAWAKNRRGEFVLLKPKPGAE